MPILVEVFDENTTEFVFNTIENLFNLVHRGDTVAFIELLPDSRVERIKDNFKTDKLKRTTIFPLSGIKTWKHFETLGLDLTKHYEPALYAAEQGYLELLKYFVEKGADFRDEDDEALRYAARNGHIEVVEYLLEQGADIHAFDDGAIFLAVQENQYEMIEYLLEQGANIYANHSEALFFIKNPKMIEYLKEIGICA